MNTHGPNPFRVTRAADYSDKEILEYWVDLSDDGGFESMVQPTLEMPMLILGGKGSGKTHLMRYFSFPLQRIRHSTDLIQGICGDGYLGLYMRCSGLNSTRFCNKGQSSEVWKDVFAYYMELWLAQLAVDACAELFVAMGRTLSESTKLISSIRILFDDPHPDFPNTFTELQSHLYFLRRELDIAINNCALDRTLKIKIRATSGKLVFGIPQAIVTHVSETSTIRFVYLIDEFENLTTEQQKLINTLIREKENPCSFKIGARLWGVRTYSTYCADEDNKEGSEYERLPLDARMRDNEERYAGFARRLVQRRLVKSGILTTPLPNDDLLKEFLSSAFKRETSKDIPQFLHVEHSQRPYFKTLRNALLAGLDAGFAPGIDSTKEIDYLIRDLSLPNSPILEKLNCFMLYQQWSSGKNLVVAAAEIKSKCFHYSKSNDSSVAYYKKLGHWKTDLIAQLRRESNTKQLYSGFDRFIELSWGNPRHLLILLKHVISWASFKAEIPFTNQPISHGAQFEGVKEAADWFYRDAVIRGADGRRIQEAINRIGTLFRSIRYSHKPSECSLSTFSVDPASISSETDRLLRVSSESLMLIDVGQQKDRNSERVDWKFQLNRMLAPRWEISYSRRGALALSGKEVNALFDPEYTDQFEGLLKLRIDRMKAPFFRTRASRTNVDQDVFPWDPLA